MLVRFPSCRFLSGVCVLIKALLFFAQRSFIKSTPCRRPVNYPEQDTDRISTRWATRGNGVCGDFKLQRWWPPSSLAESLVSMGLWPNPPTLSLSEDFTHGDVCHPQWKGACSLCMSCVALHSPPIPGTQHRTWPSVKAQSLPSSTTGFSD